MHIDARLPIPPSPFPSTWRNESVEKETEVKVEGQTSRVGREGLEETRFTSVSATRPDRKDHRFEEDVRIYEEHDRRPREKVERVEIKEDR